VITVITGGARSGKSGYAQKLAENSASQRVYIATARPDDEEMRRRIGRHQASRGESWRTVEEPLDLTGAIKTLPPDGVAVVDCLTLWLSNMMMEAFERGRPFGEDEAAREGEKLRQSIAPLPSPIILVTNEVGMGVMPTNELARRFGDCAGRLNQIIAEEANRVVLMTCGIATIIKNKG